MAKAFIIIGVIFIIFGLLLMVFKDINLFKLPGDIYIEKENFRFYFPITTSILLSIIFSAVFYLISRFFR